MRCAATQIGDVGGSEEIDVDHPPPCGLPLLVGDVVDPMLVLRGGGDGCVVDEDVHAPESLDGFLDEGSGSLGITDVSPDERVT